jgi:hypothetical protein
MLSGASAVLAGPVELAGAGSLDDLHAQAPLAPKARTRILRKDERFMLGSLAM